MRSILLITKPGPGLYCRLFQKALCLLLLVGLVSISSFGSFTSVKPRNGPVHFVAYDGNGNVVGLVDGSTGLISASYEYGPFGEPIRVTGPMGNANPFRFSTKYTDGTSGLIYYGYRYYNPDTGRWLSRDPLGLK